MTASRQQAVANALASTTNTPRYCARWTRERFGVAALGDYDGDGAADAEDMWKAARVRHEDDNPPAGVPVYWGGGSQDNGHAAVSLGGGMIRSTDAGGPGRVASVPLDFPTRQWGMPYLGWSEDLYGHVIPDENARSPRDIARDAVRPDLNAAMKHTKAADALVKGRPRLKFAIRKMRYWTRRARRINRGD